VSSLRWFIEPVSLEQFDDFLRGAISYKINHGHDGALFKAMDQYLPIDVFWQMIPAICKPVALEDFNTCSLRTCVLEANTFHFFVSGLSGRVECRIVCVEFLQMRAVHVLEKELRKYTGEMPESVDGVQRSAFHRFDRDAQRFIPICPIACPY